MKEVKIRKPKKRDVLEIVSLLNSEKSLKDSKEVKYDKGDALQFFKNSEKCLVLEKNKKVIGLVAGTLYNKAGVFIIHFLIVDKKERRKGYGFELLKNIEFIVKDKINRIIFYSNLKDIAMHNLSKKLNYKKGEKMYAIYKKIK